MRGFLCVVASVFPAIAVASANVPATQPAATTQSGAKGIHSGAAPLPTDPHKLLRVKWDAVLKVLKNDKLDPQGKEAAIETIVVPWIDFPLMAKLSLGKTNWRRFSPDQRERFVKLFTERLKASYRKKIARYRGQEVIFKPCPLEGKAGGKRRVPPGALFIAVELKLGDSSVAILHKLRKVGKQWKMYDTEIEGVSILLTYRSQFNDILRHGTAEGLLNRLAKPVED